MCRINFAGLQDDYCGVAACAAIFLSLNDWISVLVSTKMIEKLWDLLFSCQNILKLISCFVDPLFSGLFAY